MRSYYYLNGSEKIGPISEDDLKQKGLPSETLIWTEGFDNWIAVGEVEEITSTIPPPIPTLIVNHEAARKSRIKSRNIAILFASLISLGMTSSYVSLQLEKRSLKTDLINRINLLMKGNDRIISATYSTPIGDLKLITKPKPLPKLTSYGESMPEAFKNLPDYRLDQYKSDIANGIISRFTLERGGFVIMELKKEDEGYELTTKSSKDLNYKRISNMFYRKPSIPEAYLATLNFYKDEAKSYFSESGFVYLQNFEFLKNELYEVKNSPNSLTNHFSSQDLNSINFAGYEVFVSIRSKFYKIQLRNEEHNLKMLLYLVVGTSVFVGVGALMLLSKSISWLK